MKQYPTYKESGVQWIGQIPEHWEVSKLKNLAHKLQSGGTPEAGSTSFYTDRGDGIPWVTIGDMSTVDSIKDTAKHITEEGRLNKNLKIFPKGTLLYSIYATIGKVSELACPATINQAILAISLRDGYFQPYCKYALKAQETFVVSYASANTQANLNAEKVSNFIMPLPSLVEQQAIAQFLDSKTAKIDESVLLYEQQKADLVEYRKALISDTVTRGLNPNVPLKDSGIDWIGVIPNQCKITKLKYLVTKIGSGVTPTGGANVYSESGILFIRSQNVYPDGLRLDDVAYISEEIDNNMPNSRVQYGDVLLNITGASIGRCSTYEFRDIRANVNQHVCIVRPNAKKILSKYLQYMLNAKVGQKQIALRQTGGNREGLNFEQLSNFDIPVPSLTEQQAIVSFLDTKTAMIDEAIHRIDEQIADLKAYRTALITDAVTGKIDVRKE